ncbi:MAG: S49 family peptidase [Rhodovarius sp.]|nr:S49 family peptidase [Rhodovarius sp.]
MRIPFLSRAPVVPLVRLEGLIAPRRGALPGAALDITAAAPLLERAFTIRRAPAVFLAVNSPGGSPVQASLIGRRIRQLAERHGKPVVAVVEDAAASAGYWIACAADEIIADPASILGSIGVLSAGFGAHEALARLGLERRIATAGEEKAFLDPFSPLKESDRDRLRALLDALHEEFKSWVRDRRAGRLQAPEEVLFTGRFWTGREAVALGLADGLGDAAGEARRRFGEEARLLPLGPRRRRFPWGLLGDAALAFEERAAWARLGL